jgi:hypothetical protein
MIKIGSSHRRMVTGSLSNQELSYGPDAGQLPLARALQHAGSTPVCWTPASAWTTRPERHPRGAFFGSIHATLNHLLWGDTLWLARFAAQGEVFDALPADLLALPAGARYETELHADWAALRTQRERDWMRRSKPGWLRCRRTSRRAPCATATQRVCSENIRCGRR